MAVALEHYIAEPERAFRHGAAGRERVQRRYNMAGMMAAYMSLYDALCERKIKLRKPIKPCVE